MEWLLQLLVSDTSILAPLQTEAAITGVVSDATKQEGSGTENSSTASSTRSPSSHVPMLSVVQEALGAAIAPEGFRQQHEEFCSEDECWFAGDVPGEHAAVVKLLLAHGADLAKGNTKLLRSAVKFHSREGLDILLETPGVAVSITPATAKDLLVAALFYDNNHATSRLLPLVSQDSSFFYQCAQECTAVNRDMLQRTAQEWLLQYRAEEVPLRDRALLLAISTGNARFAALLIHQGVHVSEEQLQVLWPLTIGPGGQRLLQALQGRGFQPSQ
jgi:hypothetical protein